MARKAKKASKKKPLNKKTENISNFFLKEVKKSWLTTWILIYSSFMILDLFTDFYLVTGIKYLGIFLCAYYIHKKAPKDALLNIAIFMTLLSDTLLTINNTSIAGIFAFCFVQFFHLARFAQTSPKVLIGYFTAVVLVFFFGVSQNITPIYVIASCYAGTLIFNILLSRQWKKKENSVQSKLAYYGFLMFICCDICTAISYFASISIIPIALKVYADYIAWAFYYPSQVFISNSSKYMLK